MPSASKFVILSVLLLSSLIFSADASRFRRNILAPETELCTNPSDLKAVRDSDFKWADVFRGCTIECLGGESCITNCVSNKLSYSQGCASCFGKFGGCGKNSCFWECSTSLGGPKCEACVVRKCKDSLKSCTGLTEETLPQA